jgi:hypothetical protein
VIAHRIQAELRPDPARVVARLFLPGEELYRTHSRASQVVSRVMSLAEDEVERLAAGLLRDFGGRHHGYQALLRRHASIVSAHLEEARELTAARTLLLGATFTAEYATEAAALCNPSAVLGPDQGGLQAGQARVALSVRGIGEGHISSIGFCSAVVGPGAQWSFEPRLLPVSVADITPACWRREHLQAVLADRGHLDELAEAILHALPVEFEGADLERALAETHRDLLTRAGSATTADLLRKVVSSAYNASFARDAGLGQRVLSPSAEEESNGMEDARFTRFTGDDGTAEYRATYTAYDGRRIAPRLLISSDLRVFRAHRLAGPAARNKGMALFPRKVHGRYLALCRSDGESTSLARSADGYVWDRPVVVQEPSARGRCCRSATAGRRSRPNGAGSCSPMASARCGSTSSVHSCSTSMTRRASWAIRGLRCCPPAGMSRTATSPTSCTRAEPADHQPSSRATGDLDGVSCPLVRMDTPERNEAIPSGRVVREHREVDAVMDRRGIVEPGVAVGI